MQTTAEARAALGPYQGLTYFTEDDAGFFFGRDRWRDVIIANLRARRLTVLYGPSGVGKSSLLRAGVAARLGELAHRNRTLRFLPVSFSSWQDDPSAGLSDAIRAAARRFADVELTQSAGLLDVVEQATMETGVPLLIILDQFEDYWTYHPTDTRNGAVTTNGAPPDASFAAQLAAAINTDELAVKFLISLREDALAQLDRTFKRRISSLLDFRLSLSPLSHEEADLAIRAPLPKYSELTKADPPFEIEDSLVDAVLEQVQVGRVTVKAGKGTLKPLSRPPRANDAIEAPYLQLVMTRIWEAEHSQDSHVLRVATLSAFGGAQEIVATHVETALADVGTDAQDGLADILRYLVTPTNTKIALAVDDLVRFTRRPDEEIRALLTTLADPKKRIVRAIGDEATSRYEIFHDVLAQPLLDWVGTRELAQADKEKAEANARARAETRRAKRARRVAAVAVTLGVLALVLGLVALVAQRRANDNLHTAQSLQLAASAEATLSKDPELSTLLALQALRIRDTTQAGQALRDALPQLRIRATLRAGGALTGAAFSPDGKEIVTASADGTARIWNASTYPQLGVLTEPGGGGLNSAAFSPDGKEIVTASRDGTARIWSTSSHGQLGVLTEPARAALSPVGKVIVTRAALHSAAFSPNGKEIVTASEDGTARIWSASSHRQLGVLTAPVIAGEQNASGFVLIRGPLYSAAFSPDGKEIVTASADGTALIWSTSNHQQLTVLTEPRNSALSSAAFGPDGKEIVTASADGTARIWSTSSHQQLTVLTEPGNSALSSAAFGPTGREIVTASQDGTARIWSASSYAVILAGHANSVSTSAFSPDALEVVTASADGTAKVWNAAPLEQLGVLTEPSNRELNSAAFSPDGKEIVTASADGTARIWNANSRQQLGVLTENPNFALNSAAFSPDGKEIVTASADGIARISNASTHRQLGSLRRPAFIPNALSSAAFSPNGKRIVIAGEAGALSSGLLNEEVLLIGPITNTALSSAAFSPNGNEIVTAGADGTARIWNASTYQRLGVLTEPGHTVLHSAAFSPDGKEIVTASEDGTARIWSTSSHRQLGVLTEPGNSTLASAAFSHDGKEIVTAGADGTARIWSTSSHQQLTVLTEPGNSALSSAAFSPNGKEIVTASADGTARIWSTELAGPVQAIEQIAETRVTRQLTPSERKTYLTGV